MWPDTKMAEAEKRFTADNANAPTSSFMLISTRSVTTVYARTIKFEKRPPLYAPIQTNESQYNQQYIHTAQSTVRTKQLMQKSTIN